MNRRGIRTDLKSGRHPQRDAHIARLPDGAAFEDTMRYLNRSWRHSLAITHAVGGSIVATAGTRRPLQRSGLHVFLHDFVFFCVWPTRPYNSNDIFWAQKTTYIPQISGPSFLASWEGLPSNVSRISLFFRQSFFIELRLRVWAGLCVVSLAPRYCANSFYRLLVRTSSSDRT